MARTSRCRARRASRLGTLPRGLHLVFWPWQNSIEIAPGKYPINPHSHKAAIVPTANVVLNRATGKFESHNRDANPSTITVRSADGFRFNLDVSQIIHISSNTARWFSP